MPNGVDRNFVRYISCISGFKNKFKHWPKRIRLDSQFIKELTEVMVPEDYLKMSQKIALITDDSNPWDGLYVAEDNDGNAYDLMSDGHGPGRHDDVLNWLGIKWPDY